MPKKLTSIEDLVADTVDVRQRTQHGRFSPSEPGVEKVRTVLTAVADRVALELKPLGFRYTRSAFRFSKRSADFNHELRLRGDAHNRSGLYVGAMFEFRSSSDSLKQWMAAKGQLDASDYVDAGDIGRLVPGAMLLRFDFTDPALRESEVAKAIDLLKKHFLPYLANMETVETFRRFLETHRLPDAAWRAMVLAAWTGSEQALINQLSWRFKQKPELREQFQTQLESFSSTGLPAEFHGEASSIARQCVLLGIKHIDI